MTYTSDALKKIRVTTEPHADLQKARSPLALWIEKVAYKHKQHLVWIHVTLFLFFMTLMIIPLFTPNPVASSTLFNNLKLFSTFLFWGLWFPLVFVSVIFAGRIWCGVLCPMGAASEWANKIGLKRKIPAWLRWEGTPILSFLLITILGQTLDVRDQTDAMLEIFGGTLILAVLIGLLFGRQKRAWCRHACPIGLLLGVFSRLSLVHLAPKMPQAGGDRYAERGICPTMIEINHKAESRHCIECFRCVKPSSSGGLFVRFRSLGEEIVHIRDYHPSMAEIWFMFLATGVALGGFLWLILPQYQSFRTIVGTWFIEHGAYWIGNIGPHWLMSVHAGQGQAYNWLDFITIVGFMFFCMALSTLVLSAATALTAVLAGRYGAPYSFKQRYVELGYLFAPIAMISIIIGLGDLLFGALASLHIPLWFLTGLKLGLFIASMLWSIQLGYHILGRQQLTPVGRWVALMPSIVACLLIAAAWWPAIFGWHVSMLEMYRTHLALFS